MTQLPQVYLLSPPVIDVDQFPQQLARVLDAHDIACFRLAFATQDTTTMSQAADLCREIAHAADVPIVISDYIDMVEKHGLDGVHFSSAQPSVRAARSQLGADAIVGAHCGTSKHIGLEAGEAGADYVSFGPVTDTGLGQIAQRALFEWWSEMIELPVVADGGVNADSLATLAPVTDFFALGENIWSSENPSEALTDALAAMKASI